MTEAKAKREEALATGTILKLERQKVNLLFDYTVAIDSLTASLRNAGFDNADIKSALHARICKDIDVLSKHKSIGLLESVSVKRLLLKDSSPPLPTDNLL